MRRLRILAVDPGEGGNLAGDPAWSDELQVLRQPTVELRDLYVGLLFSDGIEGGDTTVWR